MNTHSTASGAISVAAPSSPSLVIAHDPAINYAFQQNAIPVVKELRFQNDGVARKELVIRVTTEPAFATPVEIRVQAVDANGEFVVSPLDLKLSPGFLAELNERVAGWLKVEVVEGDAVLCERMEAVSLLARNEWCGLVSLPEILSAFILPNDPAIMPILSRASDLLRESTGRGALNGYQASAGSCTASGPPIGGMTQIKRWISSWPRSPQCARHPIRFHLAHDMTWPAGLVIAERIRPESVSFASGAASVRSHWAEVEEERNVPGCRPMPPAPMRAGITPSCWRNASFWRGKR